MSARRAFLFLAMLMLACAPAAWAQQEEGEAGFSVTHEVGWRGLLVCDALNPVTVTVTGGARSESGHVLVEVGRDRGVLSRTVAPFVTTPEMRTRVEIAVSIPMSSDYFGGFSGNWVRITVFGERGVVGDPERYSAGAADTDTQLDFGYVSREIPLVLNVGERVPLISTDESNIRSIDPMRLPRSLDAYDGVDAIVLHGEAVDGLDPGVSDAIIRWVERGGRLLLVPGSATRSLAPWGIGSELEWAQREGEAWYVPRRANAWTEAPVTIDFQGARERAAVAERRFTAPRYPDGAVVVTEGRDEPDIERAEEIPALTVRTVRRTMGGGLVAVLAREPEVAMGEPIRRQVFWNDLLRSMALPDRGIDTDYPWSVGPFSSQLSYEAVDRATRMLERVEPFPYWMFAAMVGGFCLLVGPGDAFVLKRLGLRHRSWQIAFVWVALASALAWWLPGLIRPSEAQAARFVVLDAHAGGTSAMRSGVTSVFSSGALSVGFVDEDPDARWRTLSFADRAAATGFGSVPPVTHIEGRQRVPQGVRLPNWSLRALLDEGTSQVGFRASARVNEQGAVEMFVEGFGPSELSSVIVRTEGVYRTANAVESPGGSRIEVPTTSRVLESTSEYAFFGGRHVSGEDEGTMLRSLLGEAHRRTGVIESLTGEGGSHLMIGFVMDEGPGGVTVDGVEGEVPERAFVRLLVPIERGGEDNEEAAR